MSDRLLIKKYRIRCMFIFITMILVFVMFSVADSRRLFYIQEQQDTIQVKDLTLEQLSKKIENLSKTLKNKELEVEELKTNLNILKKALDEKSRISNKPIDTLSIIISTEGDVIQIR
jgi:peptidoglycan hydrolase CwlO-like protein